MGIAPVAGRLLLPTEGMAPGADPVVVLGYSYWQKRFAGAKDVIGKQVTVGNRPATIIGVAYYLGYRNPLEFNLSHAIAILLLALMATGAGESSREMLRKPFVIGRWMYSNGVRVPNAVKIDQHILARGCEQHGRRERRPL